MPATDLHKRTSDLAINGGPKAFATMSGRRAPKIGVEEFLSIAERFGFPPQVLERIGQIVSDHDLGEGPNLARYMTSLPPVAKCDALEKLAGRLLACRTPWGLIPAPAHCTRRSWPRESGRGRKVIVPAIGFFATAAAVVAAKGVPIFCDVDEFDAHRPPKDRGPDYAAHRGDCPDLRDGRRL